MKVITAGHKYELANFEPNPHPASIDHPIVREAYELGRNIENLPASKSATALSVQASNLTSRLKEVFNGNQVIQFIEKIPAATPNPDVREAFPKGELVTLHNGTTNEEVLRVLIDRLQSMQAKFPCRENAIVMTHLETGLLWLEKRTADRKARGVEGKALA